MKVSFGTITITPKTKRLVARALASGRLSSGRYVGEFEENFAQLIGAKEAVAVSSGTDALVLALSVLYDRGAKRGDEIIVPALSFVATGNAVLHAGFIPVFVDIDKETLNIDPLRIERAITKKTRAIIAVHLMGKPAAMDVICRIARRYKIFVIEDAAEAHGAVYQGKNAGTWGDMAAFSLYVAHIISTVEGGIVVTADKEFAEILRSLRCHGRACKCRVCVVNTASAYCPKRFKFDKDIRFVFERVGYSSKMNELEAAVGLGTLNLYHQIIKKRRHNLLTMMKKLKSYSDFFTTIREEKDEQIGPHAFPMILRENLPFTRNELVSFLDRRGVDTRDLFCSIPTQCAGYSFLGFHRGDFPNAEYVGDNGLHVGVHQDLSRKHIEYFFNLLDRFLRPYRKSGGKP